MLAILNVTFPFFALVACGYLAVRRGVVPHGAVAGISRYVLYFGLSAMLFRFGAATPIARLLDPKLLALYAGCGVVLALATLHLSRNARIGIEDAAFGALVTAFPNSGFMGIPLILALLGEQAVGGAVLALTVDVVLISSLCLAIAHARHEPGEGGRTSLLGAFAKALRGAAANPLPWAAAGGVLVSASGVVLPDVVSKTVNMLSDSATPVALFALGGILARNALHQRPPAHRLDVWPVVLVKLIVHPLLILGTARAAQALGVEFDPQLLLALVLVAALPGASNVSMMAENYSVDSGRIATITLLSTSLSFVTFAAAVWLLGAAPVG